MSNIKKYLEFYYGIKYIDSINEYNNTMYFSINNNMYYFTPTYLNEKELKAISSVINNREKYDQFVQNKYQNIITPIDNIAYVLIKKSKNQLTIEDTIITKESVFFHQDDNYIIKSNWADLWSKKIDYIISQLDSLDKKIVCATWYFIGMAETAINYVYPYINAANIVDLCISHRRIKKNNFNSPLNIVIDYKERDIAEYLKYLFISGDYNYQKIEEFINKLEIKNSTSAELIYGRMLFPTEFFDKLDAYINNNNYKVLEFINRIEEYEEYLGNIYIILCKKNKVKEVEWI